jgi:DGQHR domain-containing protein
MTTSPHPNHLRLPAIAIEQNGGRRLFTFAIDGKLLHSVAGISRLKRSETRELGGYQRPEVISHISEIRRYLESPRAILPNAIVVAFDETVRFEPSSPEIQASNHPGGTPGTLVVPLPQQDGPTAGWIVDGQQRSAAIRDAELERFPVFVTAFLSSTTDDQKEQFILVNATKPLPKGLIYELLPSSEMKLPMNLERKRYPAILLEALNRETDSPFCNRIQTPTNPGGTIKDNSILRMLESSLNDGALYQVQLKHGDCSRDAEIALLKEFWRAVANSFPEAWGLDPKKSRLTHGVGILSMGYLMDAMTDRLRCNPIPTANQFAREIAGLIDHCRWTTGFWDLGPGVQRKWNELQNTNKDITLVANFLLVQYRRTCI